MVGCIYKHHTISQKDFRELLSPLMYKVLKEKKICYLAGDFNMNLLNLDKDSEIEKYFDLLTDNKFMPLIESGHIDFGENKVQEAENKWYHLKEKFPSLQLHLIGKLQNNKAKKAGKIFDYIHSLDNAKLALKISQYEKEMNKKIK